MIKKIGRFVKRCMNRARTKIRYMCASEIYAMDAKDAYEQLHNVSPKPTSTAITHNCIDEPKTDLMIIVPAYNAENWLRECMESILQQKTRFSFCVKLIDDGSTDSTPSIADSYVDDQRVCVIHQENKGHSGARNTALNTIDGRYIMFVDADDMLLPDAIETLMSKADEEDADIVEGDGVHITDRGVTGTIKKNYRDIWGGPCLKVIRSKLFECIHFPERYLYEDTIIETLVYQLAEKTIMLPNRVYAYRIHENSITQKHTADMNRAHSFWIMLLMHENMKTLGIPLGYDSYCRTMRHIRFTYRRMILLPDEVKRWVFVCTRDFVLQTYGDYLMTKDDHYRMASALKNGQYGKYCVLCEC